MHSALWMLTKLQFFASWRRLFRGAKTLRGACLLLFGVVFLCLMVVPAMMVPRDAGMPLAKLGLVQNYGPLALFLYTLGVLFFSIGDQSLFFSPSEVESLFPSPLSRRELLVYKIANSLSSMFALSLLLACTNRMQFRYFFAGLTGLLLSFSFIQLVGMFVSLLGQTLSKRAYTRGRQWVGGLMMGALVVAVSQVLADWQTVELARLPMLVEATTAGRILLFPFRTFCDVIVAEQLFPDFVLSTSIALGIVGLLVFGIFRLDADYSDVADRVSRMRLEKLQRMQRGTMVASNKNNQSTRLPMLPFMQGAGPLAWRQLVTAGRMISPSIRIALVVALAVGVPLLLQRLHESFDNPAIPYFVWGGLVYITTLMSGAMPNGFRADLERMEVFKNLPISPWSVVLGQLTSPILIVTSIHWLIFVILVLMMPHFTLQWLIGMIVSPFFCAVALSASSGLFLLYPVKLQTASSPDVTVGIKTMLTVLLQYLGLTIELGIVAGAAALAYWLTRSMVFGVIVTIATLTIEAIAGFFFVWWTYQRFDVTKHMP